MKTSETQCTVIPELTQLLLKDFDFYFEFHVSINIFYLNS